MTTTAILENTSSLKNNLSELDAMLQDLASRNDKDYSSDYDILSSSIGGLSNPPSRPPPPKDYDVPIRSKKRVPKKPGSTSSGKSTLSIPTRPPRPPKLQHALIKGKTHDLVKATKRDDDIMRAPDEFDDDYFNQNPGDEEEDEEEEEDYDYDYSTLASTVREDQVDTGEAPRGDKSMVIKTDYGELKSKYHYLGFGLWENTEPAEPPPPPRKMSPPPPPPKAEPVWYSCTVSVETHNTTKELDDLENGLDGYGKFNPRTVEVGIDGSDFPGSLGDLLEPFIKEDMSEMFRRAFLEKMAMGDETDRKIYPCFVCNEKIRGRIITAMSKKFHPECFVCTYCKQQFKNRKFKTDYSDNKPYCYECFEKLLGHFGNVRTLA